MIKYYSFNVVKKEGVLNKQKVSKNHKFLHESVNKEIVYYEDQNKNKKYISYFGKVYFEILEHENRPDKFDFLACYILKENKDISDEDISLKLRNSKTLKIKNSNCYDNSDIKVVFSQNGFALIENFGDQSIKFEKIYISFLLAHSYNIYSEALMIEVSKSYSNNNHKRMLELRKEIYIFDLNCFFFNPINYKNQQQHTIWSYLRGLYSVEENHKEMKSQIKDLVNLIEIDIKDKEEQERLKEIEKKEKLYKDRKEEREKEKIKEDKRYRDLEIDREIKNKRSSQRNSILTFIGLLIAALSIGSVYADLVELGALSNIFEENK
ncbi:MAG: hypothetical protein MJK08_06645 [Campylobacterales bacterium]|nr:hypothetical protein [Campylobacterales bacterium]